MKRLRLAGFALCLSGLAFAPVGLLHADTLTTAQSVDSVSMVVPNDVQIAVHLNPIELNKTEVGAKIFAMIEKEAAKDLKSDQPVLPQVVEVLGFDPRQNISGVTVMTDAVSPQQMKPSTLAAVIQMDNTVGNIEGLAMTLPRYQSETVGDRIHHQFEVQGEMLHATILPETDGGGTLMVAGDSQRLTSIVKAGFDDESASSRVLRWSTRPGTLVQAYVSSIPEGALDKAGPLAAFELVDSAVAEVREVGDQFVVQLILRAEDDARAEQFRQLFEGMKAMMSMAGETIDDGDPDVEMRQVVELVRQTEVAKRGDAVELTLEVPQAVVWTLLESEFDLTR